MERIKKGLSWFFHSFIWLGLLLLVGDIVSKNIIVYVHNNFPETIPHDLIPGFLRVNYLINENIAFGLSLGSSLATRIVFSIVAILVVTGIIIYLIKKWGNLKGFHKAVAMMIMAGALGNVIDRMFYSAEYLNYDVGGRLAEGVVDWIDFYGIWGFNFNIADSSVVVAAFMLIIYMIVEEIIEYRKRAKLEPKENNNEKLISKSEQEKADLLNEGKIEDEQNNS